MARGSRATFAWTLTVINSEHLFPQIPGMMDFNQDIVFPPNEGIGTSLNHNPAGLVNNGAAFMNSPKKVKKRVQGFHGFS